MIMKIRLDTEKKTLQIENKVKIAELLKALKQILPNGEWKEFELEPKVIDNTTWVNPIYIETKPYYPWYYYNTSGTTTPLPDNYTFADGGQDNNIMLCSDSNNSTFNIEI